MTQFTEQYASKLVLKAPPKTRLTRETWKLHFGKHAHHTNQVELINGHWGSIGKNELLRRYVPLLLGSVGAAAFHGLIRVAYRIDADSRTEIVVRSSNAPSRAKPGSKTSVGIRRHRQCMTDRRLCFPADALPKCAELFPH